MSLLKPEQIALLYAAASEPDGLTRIAHVVRSIMDVDSAGLWLIDAGRITEISATEDVVESTPSYLAYYQNMDPWGGAKPKMINQVLGGWETFDERKLIETEFYRDFARHYGILRPLGVVVPLDEGVQASISVNRISDRNLLSCADKPLMKELGVHLHGALRLFQRMRARAGTGPINGSALDQLSFGAMICNACGRVVQYNKAAELLADGRNGLRFDSGDALATDHPSQTAQLRLLIHKAAHGSSGAMRLTGRSGSRLAVLVTPLPRDDLLSLQPCRALLSISRLDGGPSITAGMVSQLFGLSPMQTKLCLKLAAGLTFDEAATELKIAISTARTHFKSILVKTDTQNLRDLLRLLANIPPVSSSK